MARRLDRRVQRTRKLLQDALMSLILEEGYDAISIQDITDKANLGRATFYLHFKDKDELLLEVMAHLIDDFLDQVPQLSEAQWRLEDTKSVIKLFDFASQHYDLYRILTISSGSIMAHRQLQCSVAENIKIWIEKDIDELDAAPIAPTDFIANHFAGSLLSTIYWWLDQDQPYTVEEIAEMFQKVSLLDRQALMGLDKTEEELAEEARDKKKKRAKEKTNPKMDKKETEVAAEGPEEEIADAAPEEPNEE